MRDVVHKDPQPFVVQPVFVIVHVVAEYQTAPIPLIRCRRRRCRVLSDVLISPGSKDNFRKWRSKYLEGRSAAIDRERRTADANIRVLELQQ